MKEIRIITLLLLALTTLAKGSLLDASANRELEQMKKLVDIMHEKLIGEKCPDTDLKKGRRELLGISAESIQLEVQTELYRHLVSLLISCRVGKLKTSTPPTKTAPTTTTSPPEPEECRGAINLTESWRLDNKGTDLNGHSNCDTRDMNATGRPWFRFTGQAGTKLLDSCPPMYSCGAYVGLWSDAQMPSDIGVVTAFTASGSYTGGCNQYPRRASVMKCSNAASDFVYRYDDPDSSTCYVGFCGMM